MWLLILEDHLFQLDSSFASQAHDLACLFVSCVADSVQKVQPAAYEPAKLASEGDNTTAYDTSIQTAYRVKSPPCSMNCGMTRWNTEPL